MISLLMGEHCCPVSCLERGCSCLRNRYNIGRDELVGNLTGQSIDTRTLSNTSTLSGSATYNNYTYQTDVEYVPGLLENSSGKWCIMTRSGLR